MHGLVLIYMVSPGLFSSWKAGSNEELASQMEISSCSHAGEKELMNTRHEIAGLGTGVNQRCSRGSAHWESTGYSLVSMGSYSR